MVTSLQQNLVTALMQQNIEEPLIQLYQYYFEGVVTHVVMNGGNREDGADIFQDAILILVEKVKTNQYRGEGNIKTFLHGIARNLWLFELRTRQRRKNREVLYVNTEDQETQITDNFYDDHNTQQLKKVFNEIGDTCKKLLTGFYFEKKNMKALLQEFSFENEQVLRNKKSKCMKKMKTLISENNILFENLKNVQLYE